MCRYIFATLIIILFYACPALGLGECGHYCWTDYYNPSWGGALGTMTPLSFIPGSTTVFSWVITNTGEISQQAQFCAGPGLVSAVMPGIEFASCLDDCCYWILTEWLPGSARTITATVACPLDDLVRFQFEDLLGWDNLLRYSCATPYSGGDASITITKYPTAVSTLDGIRVEFETGAALAGNYPRVSSLIARSDGSIPSLPHSPRIEKTGTTGYAYFEANVPDYYFVTIGAELDLACETVGPIVVLSDGNNPPFAQPEYSPDPPTVLDAVSFLSRAWDHEGDSIYYSWAFGDSNSSYNTSSDSSAVHIYQEPGNYVVTLTVSDGMLQRSYNLSLAVSEEDVSGVDDGLVDFPGGDVGNSRWSSRDVRLGCYPNPFNPSTTLSFDLPERTEVYLQIYDLSGRLIRTLIAGETTERGQRVEVWNGRDELGRLVTSGTYIYRLQAGGFSEAKRMVLIK